MSHALWVLREVGPLNTRSKDSLLKAILKAPAVPAIFLLFPRTRFPALPSAPFAEELPELPMLPGQIGHLLPEEREPLKTACFPKQMRHKNDRAVLTRLPHPVRHNRSACFITEIFELELPKWENTYGARSTHVVSNVCVCVFLRLCVCVCAFAYVPVGMQVYAAIRAFMSLLHVSVSFSAHSSSCGVSHVLRILLSLHSQVPKLNHGM